VGIRAVWDNDEKTIVRHVYEGKWTLEEYYNLIGEHRIMLNDVDYTVDIINDLRIAGPVPGGLASAIRYAARNAPANEGINVIVGANEYVKALIDLVNKTTGTDVTEVNHVATIEEAYTLIADYRASNAHAGNA
jgi:hypothetical protein